MTDNKVWIEETLQKIDNKLGKVAVRSRNKIPYTAENGVHDDMMEKDSAWWTNGFWAGMMWLMYNYTKNEEYRITAENAERMMDKAFEDFDKLHHDVGFMWHIMSGAAYRLTGNKKSRTRNLYSASLLASRYNIDGGFIRAWPNWGDEEHAGWSIIDCLMNIPLLYWASEETNDTRYKKVAMAHADMAMRDHVRADGSVIHIVEHNPDMGEFVTAHTGQGYNEDSTWSRGQAWAIYGFVLSYIHTKKQEYLDVAIKTANYFIANCAATAYLPIVDFRSPTEPVYYDSTAGVCAACGLLEIAKYVPEYESKMYADTAIKILQAIDTKCCDYDENTDALVLMGTERYPLESMKGVHIPIIYGDFFFVEAMLKLRNSKFLIW